MRNLQERRLLQGRIIRWLYSQTLGRTPHLLVSIIFFFFRVPCMSVCLFFFGSSSGSSPAQSVPETVIYTPESTTEALANPLAKCRRAKRTEEERIEYLRADAYVASFELGSNDWRKIRRIGRTAHQRQTPPHRQLISRQKLPPLPLLRRTMAARR